MKKECCLFDTDLNGHRHGYLEYLAGEFRDRSPRRVIGKTIRNWLTLVRTPDLILVSGDSYVIFAGTVGFVRRLLGKRTSAIYIAPHHLHRGQGVVSAIKGSLLLLAKKSGILHGYAIIPFDLEPRSESLCEGWIYDIQFCTSNSIDHGDFPESESSLRVWFDLQSENSRRVIVYLGFLWRVRGADQLMEMAGRLVSDSGWALLVAGKTDATMEKVVATIQNDKIKIHDSFLSEKMFDECLNRSDLVWCYFPHAYNQSSGIFCNSFIANKMVVVRKGGFLDRFGRRHLAMTEVPPDSTLSLPPDAVVLQGFNSAATLRKIREFNHLNLQKALR